MTAEIITTSLSSIKPNPHRDTTKYPFMKKKIEALMRSIDDVGFWEGVIARKNGNTVEIAFGHHRIEAARRLGLKEAPVILRNLTDEDMMKFLGRENGEDYNSDFPVMLETWEAAKRFLEKNGPGGRLSKHIDIARLLGWTVLTSPPEGGWADGRKEITKPRFELNRVAKACALASRLIEDEAITRQDLRSEEDESYSVTVRAAEAVLRVMRQRIKQADKDEAEGIIDPETAEEHRQKAINAGKVALDGVKRGQYSARQARGIAQTSSPIDDEDKPPKEPVLFARTLEHTIDTIGLVLHGDALSTKLDEIEKAIKLPDVHFDDLDLHLLERLRKSLKDLAKRANRHGDLLDPSKNARIINSDEPELIMSPKAIREEIHHG